jgi:hypothetical protein
VAARNTLLEREGGGVGVQHGDVGAGQPPGQGTGQPLVDFHGGQPGHLAAQHVGGQARSRPHFQHLVAQVLLREHPGQQFGLDECRPLRAGTDPQMRLIHALILAQ